MLSGKKPSAGAGMIVQNIGNGGNRRDPERGVSYTQFLETRPPIFLKAEHPLEANEWLQTMEQKFRVIPQCTTTQKAEFAGLQFLGRWTNYLARQPVGREVTWENFKEAFQTQFVPEGIMRMKLEQFLGLQ